MAYLTADQWAVHKNYTNFTTYTAANSFPTETTLDRYITDASGIINEYIGVTSNITDSTGYLANLVYRMVELMIDEEQGRATEEGRPQFIPRDYLFERDRVRLASLDADTDGGFNRGVSN